jgi:hypothetical protein
LLTLLRILKNYTYVDDDFPTDFDCGDEITYRVYAYRFGPDAQGKDTKPESGRGRAYNERDYAEFTYKRARPERPFIESVDSVDVICYGDSVLIESRTFGDVDTEELQWFLDDVAIDGEIGDSLVGKIAR